jgi:3-oxoacyl-[acyl-carrier protein] reductase
MDLGLEGRTALVTGAGSWIGYGRGIAMTLAAEGCHIIAADIDLDGAQQTAAALEASGHQAMAVRADWDLDLQVNLYGQMNVAQAVYPLVDFLMHSSFIRN